MLDNEMACFDATEDGSGARTALNVSVIYQDASTRRWARELWSRVGQLTGNGGICRKSWRISQLGQPAVFCEAVRAAAKADVLLIAMRDTEEVPGILHLWAEAWLPRRARRPGALVALIGVPPQPNAQTSYAHRFLELVARKGGLDYLPRERKLADASVASRRRLFRVPANAWLAVAV
jgi:hypothetical protein